MNIFQHLTRKLAAASLARHIQNALAAGQSSKAVSYADALQKLVPSGPQSNSLLAQTYVSAGMHQEALTPLTRVLEVWPDDAASWYALGVCHDYLDDPKAAVEAYHRTLTLAPHWVIALKHLGRCAWRLGEVTLALKALHHYCHEVPDDREAHDLLGYLAYQQGRLRDASSHYAKAARLAPHDAKLDRNARLLYRRSATS
jgi:Flp pilus assembly protein TadD